LSHPPVVADVYEKTKRGASEFRLKQLAESGAVVAPPITAIVADLEGASLTTEAMSAAWNIAIRLLPPAP
jgi:hypothetical protein